MYSLISQGYYKIILQLNNETKDYNLTHIKERDMKLVLIKRLFLVVSVTFWEFDLLGVDIVTLTFWDSDILRVNYLGVDFWQLTFLRVDSYRTNYNK